MDFRLILDYAEARNPGFSLQQYPEGRELFDVCAKDILRVIPTEHNYVQAYLTS